MDAKLKVSFLPVSNGLRTSVGSPRPVARPREWQCCDLCDSDDGTGMSRRGMRWDEKEREEVCARRPSDSGRGGQRGLEASRYAVIQVSAKTRRSKLAGIGLGNPAGWLE